MYNRPPNPPRILDSENGMMMKNSEKTSFNRSIAPASMRQLADITNTVYTVKVAAKNEPKNVIPASAEEYIQKLHQENAELLTKIAEKDRLLQKFKMEFLKLRQQNSQIAYAHSQLLAELNVARDKLKIQQHEYGTMSGILRAKVTELEVKIATVSQDTIGDSKKGAEPQKGRPQSRKPRQSLRNPSLVPASTSLAGRKDGTDSKRARRVSNIVKHEVPEVTDNQIEVEQEDSSLVPLVESQAEEQMEEEDDAPSRQISSTKLIVPKVEIEEEDVDIRSAKPTQSAERPERRRSSIGRPTRRASQNVVSYREPLLKTKMRRT